MTRIDESCKQLSKERDAWATHVRELHEATAALIHAYEETLRGKPVYNAGSVLAEAKRCLQRGYPNGHYYVERLRVFLHYELQHMHSEFKKRRQQLLAYTNDLADMLAPPDDQAK